VAKKMKLIEDKVIYKCQLCLLDSFISLDTSDASQPPFSSMLCSRKKGCLFLCIYNLYTCTYSGPLSYRLDNPTPQGREGGGVISSRHIVTQ